MTRLVQLITLFICLLSGSVPSAHAGTPMSDRIAVEAGVKAELSKDLALPYAPDAALSGRTCLDGRPTKEFQGDIMEYWVNLECPYCGIEEPLRAQRENPACDFTASQLPLARELAYKARADDADAKERIVQMITRGLSSAQRQGKDSMARRRKQTSDSRQLSLFDIMVSHIEQIREENIQDDIREEAGTRILREPTH